ncbi:MAG: hypothetical protein R3F34_10060 [Planctomycetota bacterium]
MTQFVGRRFEPQRRVGDELLQERAVDLGTDRDAVELGVQVGELRAKVAHAP